MQPSLWNMKSFDTLVTISWKMDSRDRFYGFSLLFNIFAEKNTYYAGIMLDAPSIVLCSKLCRHNVSDPSAWARRASKKIWCCVTNPELWRRQAGYISDQENIIQEENDYRRHRYILSWGIFMVSLCAWSCLPVVRGEHFHHSYRKNTWLFRCKRIEI